MHQILMAVTLVAAVAAGPRNAQAATDVQTVQYYRPYYSSPLYRNPYYGRRRYTRPYYDRYIRRDNYCCRRRY